jgi:hypothetical protein
MQRYEPQNNLMFAPILQAFANFRLNMLSNSFKSLKHEGLVAVKPNSANIWAQL